MNNYFVSYCYSNSTGGVGYGCSDYSADEFNIRKATKDIEKEFKVQGVVILYFKKLDEGESF